MITGSGEEVENGGVPKQNHLLHTTNQKKERKIKSTINFNLLPTIISMILAIPARLPSCTHRLPTQTTRPS